MAAKLVRLGFARGMVRAGERVCCAVSGGADSVAMLVAMREANGEREGMGLVLSAVHVHHGLRGEEADGDEEFVRELCRQMGVELWVERVDTPGRQMAEREGVEEAARALRYGVFRKLLAEGWAETVATAHTRNDQAETVLMKFLRGAWTEGLRGIAPVLDAVGETGRVVRPLLDVGRDEVEAFLGARGQGWREDSSNANVSLLRNRVRRELLPILRGYNPAIEDVLVRTAEVARDEEAFWAGEVARLLPGLLLPGRPVRGGGRAVETGVGERSVAVEVAKLRALAAAMRRRVVRAAARSVGARLRADETAKLLALAGLAEAGLAEAGGVGSGGPRFGSVGSGSVGTGSAVSGRIGARLELRGGLRAERSARELRIWVRAGTEDAEPDEKSAHFRGVAE